MNIYLNNLFLLLAFFCLISSTSAWAEVRYIDDSIEIPLRSGPSTQHRIIRFLKSGTKLDLKELNAEDNKWGRVNLPSGTEGWVQNRYLKTTPAAKELLENSDAALKKARADLSKSKAELKTVKAELKETLETLNSLSKKNSSTEQELANIKDISKNAIRLDRKNNELLKENQLLKAETEKNQQRVTKLESSQKNQGILYGSLAVLMGILLGWLMPKMRSNKSDGWV